MYRYVCTCLHQPQTTAVAHWQRWPKCAPHLKPIWRSESPSAKKRFEGFGFNECHAGYWNLDNNHVRATHVEKALCSNSRLHFEGPTACKSSPSKKQHNRMTIVWLYDFVSNRSNRSNGSNASNSGPGMTLAPAGPPCLLCPSQLNQAKRRLKLHLCCATTTAFDHRKCCKSAAFNEYAALEQTQVAQQRSYESTAIAQTK